MKRGMVVSLSLIFSGCIGSRGPSSDPPDDPAIGPPIVQFLAGEEEQGPHLLGKYADRLARNGVHFSVVAPGSATLSVVGQDISYNGQTGAALVGLVLPASPTVGGSLRIDGYDALAGYELSYFDTASGGWLPYCNAAESPYAIAMKGEWTTSGLHNAGSMVTFACQVDGKAAKCRTWGYSPESTPGAGPGSGSGWDLNQTCTQLARADYCMKGVPHTRDKTKILIRDFIPGAEPPDSGATRLERTPASYPPTPPPPDTYYFEAAFEPRMPVRCLSKERWADLAPGGPCPDVLDDPRVVQGAKFCEEAILDLDNRALLDASETMDIALHRWSNGAGDTVTTAHGYVVDETTTNRSTVPPVGFQGPPLSDEGFLLRNLTGAVVDGVDVFKVFRQRNAATGDSVVGPSSMLTGYTYSDPQDSRDSPDFEGYLLIAPRPDAQGLFLYVNGTDYVTATATATGRPGSGYSKVGGPTAPPIGYVITAPL